MFLDSAPIEDVCGAPPAHEASPSPECWEDRLAINGAAQDRTSVLMMVSEDSPQQMTTRSGGSRNGTPRSINEGHWIWLAALLGIACDLRG